MTAHTPYLEQLESYYLQPHPCQCSKQHKLVEDQKLHVQSFIGILLVHLFAIGFGGVYLIAKHLKHNNRSRNGKLNNPVPFGETDSELEQVPNETFATVAETFATAVTTNPTTRQEQ